MEYVDGISLQAAVARTGTFSAGEAAAVGVQVADGLAQAAASGWFTATSSRRTCWWTAAGR